MTKKQDPVSLEEFKEKKIKESIKKTRKNIDQERNLEKTSIVQAVIAQDSDDSVSDNAVMQLDFEELEILEGIIQDQKKDLSLFVVDIKERKEELEKKDMQWFGSRLEDKHNEDGEEPYDPSEDDLDEKYVLCWRFVQELPENSPCQRVAKIIVLLPDDWFYMVPDVYHIARASELSLSEVRPALKELQDRLRKWHKPTKVLSEWKEGVPYEIEFRCEDVEELGIFVNIALKRSHFEKILEMCYNIGNASDPLEALCREVNKAPGVREWFLNGSLWAFIDSLPSESEVRRVAEAMVLDGVLATEHLTEELELSKETVEDLLKELYYRMVRWNRGWGWNKPSHVDPPRSLSLESETDLEAVIAFNLEEETMKTIEKEVVPIWNTNVSLMPKK